MDDLYRALYLVTFVPHLFCAAYVAGGALWLTALGLRQREAPEDPIADALRDWLPFVLGLAITFGVGPLLFVQLIDGPSFYTANLLLSHRFMALLPALIVGFYLLYVLKTGWRWTRRLPGRAGVPAAAFLCFAYTGWSWSRNHLLLERPDTWAAAYVDAAALPGAVDVMPRLGVFLGLALLVAPALLAAQLGRERNGPGVGRRLAVTAAVGAGTIVVALLAHGPVPGVAAADPTLVSLLVVAAFLPSALFVLRGLWSSALVPSLLAFLAVSAAVALRGRVWSVRVAGRESVSTYETTQGLPLFLATLVLVVGVIAWSVQRVRRDLGADQLGD